MDSFSSEMIIVTTIINLENRFRCSACPLVFGCWELSHMIFLNMTKKELLASWANSQNDNYFHSKRQRRTILSENSCHFVDLFSFAINSFSLSMRKIMWLNSQQPKTRGHVEHLYCTWSTNRFSFVFIFWQIEIKVNYSFHSFYFKTFCWQTYVKYLQAI